MSSYGEEGSTCARHAKGSKLIDVSIGRLKTSYYVISIHPHINSQDGWKVNLKNHQVSNYFEQQKVFLQEPARCISLPKQCFLPFTYESRKQNIF